MHKQRMRIGASPKLEWRVVAVADKDPAAFAATLQATLQDLTDQGFALQGQLPRDGALIISASRLAPDDVVTVPTARRRIVNPARHVGTPRDEVLYHFTEYGAPQQLVFASLVDALRVLHSHITQPREHILPVSLTTVSMTRFDPESFAYLLQTFADDLKPPPG